MITEIEVLNQATSIRIVNAPKLGRDMFQTFNQDNNQTGGGELSVLIYWLALKASNQPPCQT